MSFKRKIFEEQDAITILHHCNNESPNDTAILLEYAFMAGRESNKFLGSSEAFEKFLKHINEKIHS